VTVVGSGVTADPFRLGIVAALVARLLPEGRRAWSQSDGPGWAHFIFLVPRPLTVDEREQIATLLAQAACSSLADLLRWRGPVPGERPFTVFSSDTSSVLLRSWALAHYRAAGIKDPRSLRELLSTNDYAYCEAPTSSVRRAQQAIAKLDPAKVAAYAELLRDGVRLPPGIATAKLELREGYHRHAAHIAAGIKRMPLVLFGATRAGADAAVGIVGDAAAGEVR
jgi:hypothetical protein